MTEEHRIIVTQSEYETLLKEIQLLRERVAMLTALRDDLVYHICPSLRSEYEEKIASLERELLASQLYLLEMERILEILQAQMNQGQQPSMAEAEEKARKEYQEYQEDLNKKAKEAEDFQDQWKKKSNWYEYDDGYRNRQEDSYEEEPDGPGAGDDKKHGDKNGSAGENKEEKGDKDNKEDKDDVEGEGGKDRSSKAAALKKLYRKIVKLLHPDVHPNPTPKEKELLNQAIQAYDRGDLEAMQKIWQELTGSGAALEEETFEDSPEGIAKMREILKNLRKRLKELDEEIRQIRSAFPYTMKEFLENEEAVEKRRSQLLEQIDQTRKRNRQLNERIQELKNQLGQE